MMPKNIGSQIPQCGSWKSGPDHGIAFQYSTSISRISAWSKLTVMLCPKCRSFVEDVSPFCYYCGWRFRFPSFPIVPIMSWPPYAPLPVPLQLVQGPANQWNAMPTVVANQFAPQSKESKEEREGSLVEMFCVKCKEKKAVPEDQTTMEKTAKGRKMLRATCPICGTNMAKFTK